MRFADFVEINPSVSLRRGEEYPFVEMQAVTPGFRYIHTGGNTRIYNGGGAKFMDGDTLFARITPCLENGKIAQFASPKKSAGFGSTEFFVFRARPGISDPAYVFYLCSSDIVRKPAEKSMSGASGRQRADISSITELDVPSPPLPIQQHIASILSAYDDLIENNTRRIAILEEMARRIYEEWFVYFRFPGHEKVQTIESELGSIPKNWGLTDIRQVSAYINRGISPKYDDTSEEWVINQKCIRDGKLTVKLSRRHSSAVPTDKYVQFGDVLINSTGVGTLGRVAQVYRPFNNYTVDSHVTIVRPSNVVNIDFFGLSLLMKQDEFARLGFGATNQTELNRSSVANVKFLLPPIELQERFSEIVAPLRKAAIVLDLKNDNLRTTRDFLLPKLISGEIDVSHFPVPESKSV